MLVSQDNKRLGRPGALIRGNIVCGLFILSMQFCNDYWSFACFIEISHSHSMPFSAPPSVLREVGLIGWSTPSKSQESDLVRSCTSQHQCSLINDEN